MMSFKDLFKTVAIKPLIYSIGGILLGFHIAGSFNSISAFIFSVIGAVCAIGTSENITRIIMNDESGNKINLPRSIVFGLCAFVLFGLCWFTAGMMSAPVMPGDEDEYGNVAQVYASGKSLQEEREIHLNMFFALITPTLIGAHFAIKQNSK